jgi:hypothetical protein
MKPTPLILSFLFISTIASPTYGSLGRKADPQTFPPGICRLTFKKSHYEDTYHCTGSLVSPTQIKTAGHCLEKAVLKKVDCGGFENLPIKTVKRFDDYSHRTLMREEENRWQDHALITLSKSVGLPPLKMVKNEENLKALLPTFSQCLIAGFGLYEETSKGTGTLIGTIYSPKKLEIRGGLVVAKGAYEFELLPGDSGGALLCYGPGRWYDLGVASAHNWEHESLYAANFAVESFYEQYVEESLIEIFQNPARKVVTSSEAVLGEVMVLKPYTIIRTNDGLFFNGDAKAKIKISKIAGDEVTGEIESVDMSRFYTCDPQFLCYGDKVTGTIKKRDLK